MLGLKAGKLGRAIAAMLHVEVDHQTGGATRYGSDVGVGPAPPPVGDDARVAAGMGEPFPDVRGLGVGATREHGETTPRPVLRPVEWQGVVGRRWAGE